MTKKDFLSEMDLLFHKVEKAADYYWEYKNQLETLRFVAKLSCSAGLINDYVCDKTVEYCNAELKRYA